MNTQDLSRNPFSDYNANSMDPKKILDYWCSPFALFRSRISERDIYEHDMPIVFMGGRGTGKTMFLKYFSYPVQCEVANQAAGAARQGLLSFLRSKGGIGFYLRFDGPVLRSFEGKGLEPEKWDAIFTHYFELQVCKSYIEVILDLVNRDELARAEIEKEFVPRVAKKLGRSGRRVKLERIFNMVEDALAEITSFREKIAFSRADFVPSKPFVAQDLSFGIVEIAMQTIPEFRNGIKFVILIDEYENYLRRQQVVLNTLLKFVKPGITFRIGTRLEGFHTYDTISPKEFIKEGRDYTRFVFEDILVKDRRYREFLVRVARRRLEMVPAFKERDLTDISCFLGKREDLQAEAANLMGGQQSKTRHFDLLRNAGLFKTKLADDAVKKIKNIIAEPEHPLLEVLNMIWVARGNEPAVAKKAMKDYLGGKIHTPLGRKYRLDYVDKYKLSLMILLASQYRKPKMYYSFNTFCFLSSGIVGTFIELCRRSFQYAYFEDPDTLVNEGVISDTLQNRAARDLAHSELEMVNRIQKHGHNLYLFAKNLGNIFEEFQKDPLLRYPETNQFTVDASFGGDDELEQMFKTAIQWSIVQHKSSLQHQTPGGPKTDIYTLNRVFSPLYDLSYRTRGGYSERFDASYLRLLMTQDGISLRRKATRRKREPKEGLQQHLI